jgi:hypothetical protein
MFHWAIYNLKKIAFIALMTEAVRTSETSVYFNETTRHYIPEGCVIFTFAAART